MGMGMNAKQPYKLLLNPLIWCSESFSSKGSVSLEECMIILTLKLISIIIVVIYE